MYISCIVSFIVLLTSPVFASIGERTNIFDRCFSSCNPSYCIRGGDFYGQRPNGPDHWFSDMIRLTPWPCEKDCIYMCMWSTVPIFKHYGYNVPQFYGKWPFVRFMGIQEPASAIFSFLNMLAHIFGLFWFCRRVPSNAPMFKVWICYGLCTINTWFSSTVFHSRDTPTTEIMDYLGGFSMVEMFCFSCFCRILGPKRKVWTRLIGLCLVLFLFQHGLYMTYVRFDYDYNLKVTITMGVLNALIWVVFCIRNWRKRPYVYKCLVTLISLNALLLLEVRDFPPIFWIFDAHSLWHLGTIPFGILWFSFLIDDTLALHKESLTHEKWT